MVKTFSPKELLHCDAFKDGGTVIMKFDCIIDDMPTEEHVTNMVYIDYRLDSNTKGTWWNGYPGEVGSSIIKNKELIDKYREVVKAKPPKYNLEKILNDN